MDIREARRRLEHLPARLPDAPRPLVPVLLSGARARPGGVPGAEPGMVPTGVAGGLRDGAVLVLLYPDPTGQASVLLTVRSAGGHRHAGEVSFPGGAVDAGDGTPLETALREAREEVGLDPEQAGVTVAGALASLEVSVSGFRLVPVLAVADRRPDLHPDPREVAAILETPVSVFLPGAPITIVEEERAGRLLRFGAYVFRDHLIWGATAKVLGQLGAVLGDAD